MTTQTSTPVNTLWLMTLTLAEITRLKFGKGMSLTNPVIEENARKHFAKLVGIPAKSTAKEFLSQLKRVHTENDLLDKFTKTLEKFKLNANDF